MQGGGRLPRHPGMIGLFLPAALDVAELGVFAVAVLHLVLGGLLRAIQHLSVGDNVVSPKLQIPPRQGLEENHGARPVRDGMKQLHGNPAAVIPHPETIAAVFPLLHLLAGVGHVRLHQRPLPACIQVIPEKPPVQGQAEGGDPPHRVLQGRLQHGGIDRLLKRQAHPEHRGPVTRHHRRINLGGIVQPVPVLFYGFRGFHRVTPFLQAVFPGRRPVAQRYIWRRTP